MFAVTGCALWWSRLSSKTGLASRNITTDTVFKFLAATLKKGKEIGEINFNIFYLTQTSKILSIQPEINIIIINELFCILFWYYVFKIQGIFYTQSTFSFELVTFQVPGSRMWLVSTLLDRAALEDRGQCNTSCLKNKKGKMSFSN